MSKEKSLLIFYLCVCVCVQHMCEAAEARQQLETEHEQALEILSSTQQEIQLLRKAKNSAKHTYIYIQHDTFLNRNLQHLRFSV